MAFDERIKNSGVVNDDRTSNPLKTLSRIGDVNQPRILQDNPNQPSGVRGREKIMWRIPSLGMVSMYINPQQFKIDEKKVIQKQRTKGGYVIQYWGEELATITLEGHTGSGGIEAINILRQVYRAEQHAYEGIAATLIDQLKQFANVKGATDKAGQDANGDKKNESDNQLFGSGASPSLMPTLGSLAAAVELYYQGWVFKGFFETFYVTESVNNGVGVFHYGLVFTVLDKRGVRKNFMPWHRESAHYNSTGAPTEYSSSDSSNTPLTYGGEKK